MLYLDSKHFQTNGNSVNIGVNGFSVVLFYSNNCRHCHTMGDIFDKLDKGLNGVTIAKVLLDDNKDLINTLKQSGVELKYVPFVVFFAKGEPYMIYSGPNELKALTDFIVEVANTYNVETENTNHENNSMTSKQNDSNSFKSTATQGCAVNDKNCLQETYENKKKEGFSACYTTMEDAYANK